jgi:hypothetical protein
LERLTKRYTGENSAANLPGVDIGSTIEVEYRLPMKNKPTSRI